MAAPNPLHVFIDTNVFLSFLAFSSDEVEELKKIVGLIKKKHLFLYLTEQVRDEYYRNRETTLASSISALDKESAKPTTPRFLHDYAEAQAFRSAVGKMQNARKDLVVKAKSEAAAGVLAIDKLFSELLNVAPVLPTTNEAFSAAYRRMMLRNPPGKPDSLGDQLNWETLLANVPHDVDLHIISADGDFASALDKSQPHQFLINEWSQTHTGLLAIHKGMKPFLDMHFPAIKLAVDIEKIAAIQSLKWTGSFSSTHVAIAKLKPFVDLLNETEAIEVIMAGLGNSQINWIAGDPDVRDFYRRVIEPRFASLPPEIQTAVVDAGLYKPSVSDATPPAQTEDIDEIPF